MLIVALVGCGNIAKIHAAFLKSFNKTEIVGVCDKSLERAKIFSEKYYISYYTDSVSELIENCSPDVVHVLTPTSTHAHIAIQALNHDCHVFVEKPLCTSVQEAEDIQEAVKNSGKFITVNHSLLRDPIYQSAKKKLEKKSIGAVTHVDFLISDDFIEKYKKGVSRPWVAKQSLGIFQDLLPHPIYIIQDLLGEITVNSVVIERGNESFPEFLQVCFSSQSGVTATITLSLRIWPIQQRIHVFCENGNIIVNYRNFYKIIEKNINLPQPIPRLYLNLSKSFQLVTETIKNYSLLLSGKIHPYKGLRNVITDFYNAIENNNNPPISIDDGLKVVRVMNEIEKYLKEKSLGNITHSNWSKSNNPNKPRKITSSTLVTGATGFLGSHLVARLISGGKTVRVLCRESSDISKLPDKNVEIVYGDMRNIDNNPDVLEGIDTVFHCASATSGSWYDHMEVTVEGTRKFLESAVEHGVKKFIHISSMGIINYIGYKNGDIIKEDAILEQQPDKRGYYTKAKLLQENLVKKYIDNSNLNITIIRPGIIIDPKNPSMLSDVGFRLRNIVLHIGIKRRMLRIVSIDNLVNYILASSKVEIAKGKTYNALDYEVPNSIEYIKLVVGSGHSVLTLRVPVLFLIIIFGSVDFLLSKLPGQEKRHLTYKLIGMTKSLRYDTSLINSELY